MDAVEQRERDLRIYLRVSWNVFDLGYLHFADVSEVFTNIEQSAHALIATARGL